MNLNDPTPREEVKQRQGPGGRTLDYIDARFVMDRLDQAAGQFGWQDKYEDLPNGSVRCCIGILTEAGYWVWKCDVGDQSDIEPMKGAYSDAFKRAAVKWGIGRDLYGDHVPPKPVEAPRKPVEPPASVPPSDEPYPWNEPSSIFPDAVVMDECPDHHKPFKYNARGGYCPTKVGTGWCQRKPVPAGRP